MENIYNCSHSKNTQTHRDQRILTSSIDMKCFKCLQKRYIVSQTQDFVDHLQFAYQTSRGTEDTILTPQHLLHTHWEPKDLCQNFICGLFIQITNYNYLAIALNYKLKWDLWTNLISTKTQQRMYFLKELLSFND